MLSAPDDMFPTDYNTSGNLRVWGVPTTDQIWGGGRQYLLPYAHDINHVINIRPFYLSLEVLIMGHLNIRTVEIRRDEHCTT
jgi:hypothetical protein